jgi:hypothetical protein
MKKMTRTAIILNKGSNYGLQVYILQENLQNADLTLPAKNYY